MPIEEAPEQKKAKKRKSKEQNSRNTRSREITCSWYFCSEREVKCGCVAVEWNPILVHTHRKVVHSHTWGTDELMQKHHPRVFAPKGISN